MCPSSLQLWDRLGYLGFGGFSSLRLWGWLGCLGSAVRASKLRPRLDFGGSSLACFALLGLAFGVTWFFSAGLSAGSVPLDVLLEAGLEGLLVLFVSWKAKYTVTASS